MIRANFGRKYRIFLKTGPAFDIIPYKQATGIMVAYNPLTGSKETETSGSFNHENYDFAILTGLGFRMPVKNIDVFVEGTWHAGFSSIEQNSYISVKTGVYLH